MNEINKRNLLSAVCVFSFVAFAFAIAQTFGNTYAYTSNDCPGGWNYMDSHANINGVCTKTIDMGGATNLDKAACNHQITQLGLAVDYSGISSDKPDSARNYCVTNDETEGYTAYISIEDYLSADTYYTITFNPNGGTIENETIQVEIGKFFVLPSDVYKDGDSLGGWTRANGNEYKCDKNSVNYYPPGTEVKATGDNTFYACWTSGENSGNTEEPGDEVEPQTFTASFDANKGELDGDDEVSCTTSGTSESCKIRTLPSAEREGFLFMGWGTSKSCTEGSTSSITLTEDDTYYACWIEDTGNEYTVAFNTNGGSLHVNENKTSITSYNLTSLNYANYKAQKEGSKFTGWRTNTTTCDDAKTSGTIELTKNLNLVACYEIESGGVTENPNTGSSLLYVVYLIGILALGYTGYYAYKIIKVKK